MHSGIYSYTAYYTQQYCTKMPSKKPPITTAMAKRKKAPIKNQTSPRAIVARKREAEAMELRLKGYSYSKIGKEMGITPQSAHAAIARVLFEIETSTVESVEQIRRIELERLDLLMAATSPLALRGDLRAVAQMRGLIEDRRKMLGLDAAAKHEVTGAGGGPIGVYAVPVTAMGDGEWVEMAQNQAAGEDEAAQKLLGD